MEHPIEVYKVGAHYVAHRPSEPGHDCAAEPAQPHGTADSSVGAHRRLLAAEVGLR